MAPLNSLLSESDSDLGAVVDTSPTLGRARARYRGPGDDHPKRSAILDLLKDGEQCAGEIARRLDMTKPTASHHLATLAENGLVQWRQKGCFRFYALVESGSAKPVAEPPRAVKQDPVETPFALAFKRLARARGIEVVERSIGGLAKQQART